MAAANCVTLIEEWIVLAGQEERVRYRPAWHDVVVRYRRSRRIVVEAVDHGVAVGARDIARHHLGAAVEIRTLLHQDLGADAALFVARDDGRGARAGVGGGPPQSALRIGGCDAGA